MSLRERIAFLGQLSSDFGHTGALQPSSRYLARAMVEPLREARTGRPDGSLRILEIGPGTGAVTRAIAATMGPTDELVCYEISAHFTRFLRRALQEDSRLSPLADRIEIRNAPAQEIRADTPFDLAICSAPLNNFGAGTIEKILDATISALSDGGTLTFFEYLALPWAKRRIASGSARRRLDEAWSTKERWMQRHGRGSSIVWANLPPARVQTLTRE